MGPEGDAAVERVEDPDRVGGRHVLPDLVGREPRDPPGLVGRCRVAGRRAAAEHQRDDPALDVLVDPGEPLHFDLHAGLLGHLAAHACVEGLGEFEDAAGRLPMAVVPALDDEHPAVVANHDAGDADGVCGTAAQRSTLLVDWMTGSVGVQLGRIDRHDDRPPYRQIAEHLRAAIDSGALLPGDRLPSEAELKQHYGVARMTARQAIQELRSEGRVIAEHGRGVFVRQPAPIRRLASDRIARKHRQAGKAAFLAEAEEAGIDPYVDQIEVARVEPQADVQERLHLSDGERVVRRSRRYLADGRPVKIALSFLPLAIAEGTAIVEINTGPGGVYARLEDAGYTFERFVEEVSARMPTAEERRRLDLHDGVPVLVVVRTAYDTTGRPLEVCEMIMVAPAYVLAYDIPAH
jgi:GntR family transcriptional regulator